MEKGCGCCFYWLGGVYDCCRLNLEAECRAGGYEAWRPKRVRGKALNEEKGGTGDDAAGGAGGDPCERADFCELRQ